VRRLAIEILLYVKMGTLTRSILAILVMTDKEEIIKIADK
jgi:hypothetical protein